MSTDESSTMKCPYCSSNETKVLDKRETEDLEVTRRRRECLKCEKRFTTYERIEMIGLRVIKKDGSVEAFDRNKILSGVIKACEKRPIKIEKIEKLADEVETELRKQDSTEISSQLIGELIIEKLKKLDEVAYVRFASVYRRFKDADQFVKEIKELAKSK